MSAAASTDAQPAVRQAHGSPSTLRAFEDRRPQPVGEIPAPWWRRHALPLSILGAGLVARLWLVWAQLPAIYHPDEPANMERIEFIAHSGDLNPHFFNYPSLFLYLQAAVSFDGPIFGWLIPGDRAVPPVTNVMGSSFAPSVYTVLLHRALSVAFGVALIAVVWGIARRAFGGRLVPAVAAGLIALSPNLIEHSTYVTPDMLAALTVSLVVLAALHVLDTGSTRAYVLAGLAVGLAVGAKYNAALAAVAIAAACALRLLRDRDWWSVRRLALAGVAAGVGFLVTTPYALLDHTAFLKGLEFERKHYATGHVGMQGDTPSFYAGVLFREELAITLPALIGIAVVLVAGTRARRERAAVLLAFPLVYAAFVFTLPVRNDRTIMVVLPVLAVFAGVAVRWVVERVRTRLEQPARRPVGLALAALLAALVVAGFASGATGGTVSDARVAAAGWIEEHVPAGSHVVVESYSPWVDPARYRVEGMTTLIRRDLPAGTDYVVASHTMFGRFTDHRDQFPDQSARYDRLFAALHLVKEFPNGADSVRVYAVPDGFVAP